VRKQWKKVEIDFIKKNYPHLAIKKIATILGKTEHSITGKAFKLKLKRIRGNLFEKYPTSDLGYILGTMLGDGSISKNQIVLSSKDKIFVENFQLALENIGLDRTKIFKIDWYNRQNPNWSVQYRLMKGSKPFATWYKKLELNDIKKLLLTNKIKKEFVRGFYESEGNICEIKGVIKITIVNKNREILHFINELIEKLGIKPFRLKPHSGNAFMLQCSKTVHCWHFLYVIKPCIKFLKIPHWFTNMIIKRGEKNITEFGDLITLKSLKLGFD